MAGSQLNPALYSNISVILEKVFVATGVDIKFKYGLEAEIIDLKSVDSKCHPLINSHNLTITSGAVGGIIEGTPIICGGRNLNGYVEQDCTLLKKEGNVKFKMLEKRMSFSSVILNKTTLWVVGGKDMKLVPDSRFKSLNNSLIQ